MKPRRHADADLPGSSATGSNCACSNQHDPVAGPVPTVNTETGLCEGDGCVAVRLHMQPGNYKRATTTACPDGCRDAAGPWLHASGLELLLQLMARRRWA